MSRKTTCHDVLPPLPVTINQLQNLEKKTFVQSDKLIESVFEQPFKELELKVLCLISKFVNDSKFTKTNTEAFINLEQTMGSFLKVDIGKEEFCDFLHLDPSNFYTQIKTLSKELLKKSILLESIEQRQLKSAKKISTKKRFLGVTLFSAIGSDNKKAIFCINPILQFYLQHLRSNFTRLSLEHISNMNSSHAIKIYQLLKKSESVGKRSFTVEELKKTLGIMPKAYLTSFTDFKRDVLQIAERNINEHSDIKISFTTKKEGKKTSEIIFRISSKETHFQQAIKDFTNQMDTKFFSGKMLLMMLNDVHKLVYKHWIESNKDIEKNKELFELWIENNTKNYKAELTSKLEVIPLREEDGYIIAPQWYKEFLKIYLC